jgi:hypothetical protein
MHCEGKLKLKSHNTSYCLIEVVTKAGLTVHIYIQKKISVKCQYEYLQPIISLRNTNKYLMDINIKGVNHGSQIILFLVI